MMALTSTATTPAMLDAALTHLPQPKTKLDLAALKAKAGSVQDKQQVRLVQPHEYKEAAACLAEAFRNDEVVRYPSESNADMATQSLTYISRYT